MPLYGSPNFHPYVAKNHLEAAKAFACGLVKAEGLELEPREFTLTHQSENALRGAVHHFSYLLFDPMGAIAGRREIRVIHYKSVA